MFHLRLAQGIGFIIFGFLLILLPVSGNGIVQAADTLAPKLTGKDGGRWH